MSKSLGDLRVEINVDMRDFQRAATDMEEAMKEIDKQVTRGYSSGPLGDALRDAVYSNMGKYTAEQIELERLKVGLEQHVSPHLMRAKVDLVPYLGDRMIARLEGEILADKEHIVTHTYPDGWFEALKYAIYKKLKGNLWHWVNKKWPVKWKEFKVSARAIYPDLQVKMPDRYHTVRLQRLTKPTP